MEACRIAVRAGAVVIDILARGERVRAAPDAIDPVITGDTLSALDAAMGIDPIGAVATSQNDIGVHPGARLVDIVVVPNARVDDVVGGPDSGLAIFGPGQSAGGR